MSRKRNRDETQPKRQEIQVGELKSILERARSGPLEGRDIDTLSAAVDTLAYLTEELERAGTTIARLRQLLFGARSEKTADVVAGGDDEARRVEVAEVKRLPQTHVVQRQAQRAWAQRCPALCGGGAGVDRSRHPRARCAMSRV